MSVTFNPTSGTNKYSGITLSAGNLTATPDGSGPYEAVRASAATTVTKFIAEVALSASFTPANVIVGVDDGTTDFSTGNVIPGSDNSNGVGLQIFGGQWYIVRGGGVSQGPFSSPSPATSQKITLAGDKGVGSLKFFINGTQIGSTETGISFSNWYLFTEGKGGDGATTANFAGSFTYPQSGYSAYDPGSGTTYNDTLSESATGAASLSAAVTFASTLAETSVSAAALAATLAASAPLSETAASAASLNAAATMGATLSEASTPAYSVTGGLLFALTLSESATGSDGLAATAAFASVLTETGTLGVTVSASGGSLWQTINPGTGSWLLQNPGSGLWTTVPPSSGTWS